MLLVSEAALLGLDGLLHFGRLPLRQIEVGGLSERGRMRQHRLGVVRGRVFLTALACVIAFATFLGMVSDAGAWYHSKSSRAPGRVLVPQVVSIDEAQYTTYGPFLTLMSNQGPTVYRSPRTRGPQDVLGIYQIERYETDRWVVVTQQVTPLSRIRSGYRAVQLPRLYRSPRIQRGYFRVSWGIAWQDARTGGPLGATIILPSQLSDFRCATPHRPCESAEQWIRIGRANALGGGW
jgi:hypothetical protein